VVHQVAQVLQAQVVLQVHQEAQAHQAVQAHQVLQAHQVAQVLQVVQAHQVHQVPQATSGTATITNLGDNRVLTSTGVQGEANAEQKLQFDGTVLSVNASNNDAYGIRLFGGVQGSTAPYLTLGGHTELLFGNAATGFVFDFRNNKIAFDSDSTNTFIQADTANPENLEIHADGDIELNADNDIVVPNMGTGTDNSVVIKTANNELRTDEIDSKVWDGRLVDSTGTPAATQLTIWNDIDTIEGDSNLTWDGNELLINGILTANEKKL
jgi:hypothetical protein